MSTDWMRNLNQELQNITQDDIKAAEPQQEFPDPKCVMGEVGEGIRRLITLKKRYFELGMKCDERYEGFEAQGKEDSVEARKLDIELKRIAMNIEVLEGMISLSILNAFPELFHKQGLILVKGWKVVGVDAKIIVEKRPQWHHSQN